MIKRPATDGDPQLVHVSKIRLAQLAGEAEGVIVSDTDVPNVNFALDAKKGMTSILLLLGE